jgi:hypothetical protein
MDEARRFLRYVMPGFVFGVETVLCLLIVYQEWMWSEIRSFAVKGSLGGALGGVLASGALGYIFAAIHHARLRREWPGEGFRKRLQRLGKATPRWLGGTVISWLGKRNSVLDHSEWVNSLVERNAYPNQSKRVTRAEAEVVVYADWHQRLKPDGSITEAADKKVSSLGDQTHALGAARVASILAIVAASLLCYKLGTNGLEYWEFSVRFGLMLVFSLGVTYSFQVAYRRVGKTAQGMFERVLGEALEKERNAVTPSGLPAARSNDGSCMD